MNRLSTRSAFKYCAFAASVIISVAVVIVARLIWADHYSLSAVEKLGGSVSVEPGWPLGAHVVDISKPITKELPEQSIVSVLLKQRYNRSLYYLGLNGQHVTNSIAIAINESGAKELSVVGSALDLSAATIIMNNPGIITIWCDDSLKPIFDEAAANVGSPASVIVISNAE